MLHLMFSQTSPVFLHLCINTVTKTGYQQIIDNLQINITQYYHHPQKITLEKKKLVNYVMVPYTVRGQE